jgi:ribosomal protein S18 acetylase RimI-like enzyme
VNIQIVDMNKEDLHKISEIDRSEQVRRMHVYKNGSLETIEINNDVPRWSAEEVEEYIRALIPKLENGGKLVGAFDNNLLVGVAVLGSDFLGDNLDELQMAFLYVSNQYRRHGIAHKLMDRICELARERGAKRLYISATETESAVGFYVSYGCRLAPNVNAELYALEPHDIHMIKEL